MDTMSAGSDGEKQNTGARLDMEATIDGDDDESEIEHEGVAPKVARQPDQPTAQQRREHDICHVPYRSWCKHCVRGRGKRRAHSRIKSGRDEDLPHAAIDYTFFTQAGAKKAEDLSEEEKLDESKANTVLVMKDSMIGSIFAYLVGKKGATNEDWLAKQMLDDLDSLGLNRSRIVMKSDPEKSIEDVKKDNARRKTVTGHNTTQESTAVGDSDMNGKVERGIQEVNGVVRTLRSALEERLGCNITINHPLFPWMVRHAGQVIIRYQVRSSGKTSYRMGKGVDSILPVAEFGEVVHFAPLKTNEHRHQSNFDYRYDCGIWLGNLIRTGEHLVFINDGVYRVADIKRRDGSEQWSKDMCDAIVGTPNEPVPDRGSEMKAYSQKKHGTDAQPTEMPSYIPNPDAVKETRKVKSLRTDIVEHGATEGCPGY